MSDNLKSLIDNYVIGRVGDKVTWIEEILLTNPNCTKSKSYDDNCDSNYNGDKVGGEEQRSDDLKGAE